jgi:LuxR family maltose regulon positive regulatory protein
VATTRCAWSEIRGYATLPRAQLALAQQRPRDCIAVLKPLIGEAEAAQDHHLALRLTLQLAIASCSANEPAEATTSFRRVVSMAAPAGICQTILEQGLLVGPLLLGAQENLQRTGMNPELLPYLQDMLSRWRGRFRSEPHARSASGVVGSLSPRERTILEMIGDGKSNKEIARTLEIAPETVKSHVKNIFAKLAVDKRAQAVARAQSLGLVRTH